MQVDPIKPMLTPPRTNCLKLKYDELLWNFAFKFNLRRYDKVLMGDKSGMRKLKLKIEDPPRRKHMAGGFLNNQASLCSSLPRVDGCITTLRL